MSDTMTPEEKLRADVGEIMRDPQWGKDPRLEARVNEMYKKAHPGTTTIGEGVVIDHGPNLQVRPPKPEGMPDAPKTQQASGVDPRLIEAMRPTWGEEAEKNLVAAQNTASFLFAGEPELFEGLAQAIGDDVVALKALHHVGQRLRKGA